VDDFRSTFELSSGGVVLKFPKSSSQGQGTVAIKKPGRMRWEYSKPEKQIIVSDGSHIYSCFPDTKECDDPLTVPPDDEAPSASLFLAGKGDILRDFNVARVQSPVPGTLALRLIPKKPDPDYEYLVVAFDPATYQIRGLMTRDRQAGETTTVFNDIKVNTRMSDKTFAPPPGALAKSR
jgi:outer membrane lipoprotein carrier protein